MRLKTAVATYPHTQGLKDGRVIIPGIELDHVEVSPIVGAFRRMCRGLEFDVCEMAITTYLTAKAYGKPFTALPVFVMRQFHHAPIVYNVKAGVGSPRDLEGRKVGVRAYTVTTGVWARGILATEYGVDLARITWVVNDEEHVQELALGTGQQRSHPSRMYALPRELRGRLRARSWPSSSARRCAPSRTCRAFSTWCEASGLC